MVTHGSCVSEGFQPVMDPDTCRFAEAQILSNGRFVSRLPASPKYNANRHGCSISIIDYDDDSYELGTVYRGGTETQLQNQTCSHDVPCVCLDVAPHPWSVMTESFDRTRINTTPSGAQIVDIFGQCLSTAAIPRL